MSSIDTHELQERFMDLLPSQREFLYAPERFSMIAGGYASGKTKIGTLKALLLSAAIPGNDGMILCYRGTDVDVRVLPLFFDTCPPNWIRSYNKKDKIVVLRNGSVIRFNHLHDASSSTKTRRIGANLGWFFLDQAEECSIEHWDAMISRLRLPRATKKFGFGTLNPNGHDWIWEKFFVGAQPWPRGKDGEVLPMDGKRFQTLRRKDYLGVMVNSEENRISNGGFIEDQYFDSMKDSYSADYLNRYMYCAFDDFSGKLYKDFEAGLKDESYSSVHNVEPFAIPSSWQLVTGIDVGGDSPWAVIPTYVDEMGNLIVTPGFHRRTGRVSEAAAWIKSHTPWDENRTMHVIDWENKPVMVELNDLGIYCQIANKEVMPGILRTAGYMHVQPNRKLPHWYESTQPVERWLKFRDKGSPRVFVFKTALEWRTEHDKAKWDPNKPDKMHKTSVERMDTVDAFRYVVMTRPEPSKLMEKERDYTAMAEQDPLSARAWRAYDRKLLERKNLRSGAMALREMEMDEERPLPQDGKFDFGSKGEM